MMRPSSAIYTSRQVEMYATVVEDQKYHLLKHSHPELNIPDSLVVQSLSSLFSFSLGTRAGVWGGSET